MSDEDKIVAAHHAAVAAYDNVDATDPVRPALHEKLLEVTKRIRDNRDGIKPALARPESRFMQRQIIKIKGASWLVACLP